MILIQWIATIFLWVIAAAFTISDFLCLLAIFNRRKDREFTLVIGVIVMVFAMIAAVAVRMALAVGRCL